mgnify:CR=1 FL=1
MSCSAIRPRNSAWTRSRIDSSFSRSKASLAASAGWSPGWRAAGSFVYRHELHGDARRLLARHHHDPRLGADAGQRREHAHAVEAGQVEVEVDQVPGGALGAYPPIWDMPRAGWTKSAAAKTRWSFSSTTTVAAPSKPAAARL